MRLPYSIRSADAVTSDADKVRRRPVAAILLPFLLATLAACTATRSGMTVSAPRTVDTSQAMIVPAPGGPTVISVVEERFSDAVEQKVILGTDATNEGQNYLSIRLYGPMERETHGTRSLGYRSVTAISMHNEALAAMPGIAMKASALFLRNNYGPFGYAFGQSANGDSCIFGWQQLRSTEAERENFRNAGAVQIRLRLCENGASEKELLGVMYGYTVTGSFSSEQWNPFGRPRDLSATTIGGGNPIFPDESELAAPAKVDTTRPARRRPVAATQRVTGADVEESVVDEGAAKRIVDIPSPDAISDDSSSSADVPSRDTLPKQSVVVPAPACQDGDLSCN